MRFRRALLVATILATPLAARAQPITGLYVGAGAGVNWHNQQDLKGFSGLVGGPNAMERRQKHAFSLQQLGDYGRLHCCPKTTILTKRGGCAIIRARTRPFRR